MEKLIYTYRTKRESLDYDVLETYKQVLAGKLKCFPKGFWKDTNAKRFIVICSKYLLEEYLKWDIEDIKENMQDQVLIDYKLMYPVRVHYNSSIAEVIEEIYPNQIKILEYKRVSNNFWSDKMLKEFMDWLIEKNGWTFEETIDKFTDSYIKSIGYKRIFATRQDMTILKMIQLAYPDKKVSCYDITAKVRNHYTDKQVAEDIKHLLTDTLHLNHEQIACYFDYNLLRDNNLFYVTQYKTGVTLFKLLDMAYPNEFKLWELKRVPTDYWTYETTLEAFKWVIEEKLHNDDKKVYQTFNAGLLYSYIANTGIKWYFEYNAYLL